MGINWRGQDDNTSAEATSRWHDAARTVAERFQDLKDLPLEEAVEVALIRTPGGMSREELTRRMAAARVVEPRQG